MSSGTTQLVAADQDDTASAVTLIGFDFYFMGVRQDRFSVNSNGSLRFGATAVSNTLYDPLAQAAQSLICAYGADQRTHAGNGKVHFKVTGTAPNRVLIVEWLNMQSDFNSGGTADLTYQIALSETSGTIEFVYGSMSMGAAGAADPNSSSPQMGFSSTNSAGNIGTITAAQSGTPAPTFDGTLAAPVNNLYVAGSISALTSAADGSRRSFLLTPPAVNPPGGPLTFTGVSTTSMTLNWTDSSNEVGYAIYNSTDGTNFSFLNTAAQNATSFNATSLIASTTYFWKVYALSEGNTTLLAGSQATSAATPNNSLGSGLWSSPATWSTGVVPTGNDAVNIAAGTTVTIDTAAVAYSASVDGSLQFEQTTARTLTVATDLTVTSGGIFQSNPAGTQTGHNLSIAGNLTNNGTLDFSTNADTAGAIITFTGTTNTTFSGTGATTDIRQITMNKGTSNANILELMPTNFTVRGVTTDTIVGGWLVMTNGTIKISGTFAGTSRVFASAAYTIPLSSGFWLNNPNYTVAGQNGSATNNGLLRVSQGTFNIGTATGNAMGFSTGCTVVVAGGAVNTTGRFGVAAAGNAISYTQTGGTITVCTIGNASATLGSFDLGTSLTSTIAISGGTIVTQLNATAIDYRNQAGSGIVGVTGGTLQLGNAASGAAKTFNLRGVLPNLVVTNISAGHTGTMSTTLVNFNNIGLNVTIHAGTTFNIGNVLYLMAGNTLTNNGTLTASGASSNFVWYDNGEGTQTYTGNGVTTAPITTTSIQNVIDFTSTGQWITNRINFFSGNITHANKITLGTGGATTGIVQIGNTPTPSATGTFDVAPVFNLGTGGQNISYLRTTVSRVTGPEINPARSLTNLSYDDNDPTHTLTISGGDLTANGTMTLTNGRIVTNANTLISGSAGTVTRTNGYVDGNFRKTYTAPGSKTFEVGTANGYTPVTVNLTAGTFPADFTVRNVQASQPNISVPGLALQRYWTLTGTGVTGDVTFSYLDPADIPVTATEGNFLIQNHDGSGFNQPGGSINTGANTATITSVAFGSAIASPSDWTLAEPGALLSADLSIMKTDGVTTATPGDTLAYTITVFNAGPDPVTGATVTDTFPAELTNITWTGVGSGGGNGTTSGSGDIVELVDLPAGGSFTYAITATILSSATGTLSNTATITSPSGVADPDTSNNSATDNDTSLAPVTDLSITKTDGVTTATPGGSVTYTITVSNAGPSDAVGAIVTDTFPSSLTGNWTAAGAGGSTGILSGAGDIVEFVNLPAGGSFTYTVTASISSAATGTLSNTATVTEPNGATDPDSSNNSATDDDTLTPTADLSITKTDGVTTATPGGSVTYTITVSNPGPSDVTGATVADTFPGSLTGNWTGVGAGGGSGNTSGSGDILESVDLPAGGSFTYTVSATLASSSTGTLSNTATITEPAGVTEADASNNSATDSDTLTPNADLGITTSDGVVTATPGGSVTYTITVSNSGPSDATGATVADTFPASLTVNWTGAGTGGATGPINGSGNINSLIDLPAGSSFTFTVIAAISPSATGTLSNTATITTPGGVTDSNPSNDSDTDSDTLTPVADLSITKTDGVTTATPGGSVTYTITVSNAGPSAAAGAIVADTFPAILTANWTGVGASGGTGTLSGSGDILDSVNLPPGGSFTYTVGATISSSATGTLSNTATVSAPAGTTDSNSANDSATDTDTLTPSADLSVTVTDGVTTATAGGLVTYTITVSNSGPSDAPGATVADTFPASLTANWTGAGAGGGTGTASGSGNISDTVNLPAGGSFTYTVSATISAAATGTLSNTATISAPAGVTDPAPGSNSATDTDTLASSADLAITKTDGVTSATPGGSVTYTITVSNAGPSNVTGATVADTFPASLTANWTGIGAGGGTGPASGSGNINASVNLPAGGSFTFTATATIAPSATGTLSNTATITAPGGVTDPTPTNNSATDTDTLTPNADLGITKTDGVTTAVPGGSVTYTITVSNAGPSNVTGATVADTFPASLTASWTGVGAGGGSGPASGTGNINTPVNLPAGGSFTFTVSAGIASSATGTLSNTATISAPGGVTDPNPSNNSATDNDTLTPTADLSITKTDGVTNAPQGGAVTYTITVSNSGPSDVAGATVADTFPASLTGTWTGVGTGGGTGTASGSGNIADTVNLPAGASFTYTVNATLSQLATGTLSNTATIAAPAGVTDPTPGNNSATDTDTILPVADLSITNTDGVATATPGGTVTYTITVSNAGPSDVTGATVADVFPATIANVAWTGAGAGGGTGPASGTGNINTTVDLPSGGTFTFTATADISAAVSGTLSNTATITAPGGVIDLNSGNDSAMDSDALVPNADLSITKTDGVTTARPGESVTYTIIVSNAGPSDVTGASVADTLPGSIASATWTAVGAGGGSGPASGTGSINTSAINLPAGGSFTFTVNAAISATATGTLTNTASITAPAGVTDPVGGNNTATDSDTLVNTAPVLSSTPTATPNPAVSNQPVQFTVVAADADLDTLTYAWDFMDGTTSALQNPVHAFPAPGTYAVGITVSDGHGGTASATVSVEIHPGILGEGDADGDGFSDEIEAALGSDPFNKASLPAGFTSPTQTVSMTHAKLNIRLDFGTTGNDFILLQGRIALSSEIPAGTKMIVDIGGIVKTIEFISTGRAVEDPKRLALRFHRSGAERNFRLQLSRETLAAALADEKLTAAPVKSAPRTLNVTIIVNNVSYKAAIPQVYTSRNDLGRTTTPR